MKEDSRTELNRTEINTHSVFIYSVDIRVELIDFQYIHFHFDVSLLIYLYY